MLTICKTMSDTAWDHIDGGDVAVGYGMLDEISVLCRSCTIKSDACDCVAPRRTVPANNNGGLVSVLITATPPEKRTRAGMSLHPSIRLSLDTARNFPGTKVTLMTDKEFIVVSAGGEEGDTELFH